MNPLVMLFKTFEDLGGFKVEKGNVSVYYVDDPSVQPSKTMVDAITACLHDIPWPWSPTENIRILVIREDVIQDEAPPVLPFNMMPPLPIRVRHPFDS